MKKGSLQADLAERLAALFRRRPTLCGFSVHDPLVLPFVTELCIYPPSGLAAPVELYREVVATLAQLVEEFPETTELLRGRTFARTLH
jgi:hypothetical protein